MKKVFAIVKSREFLALIGVILLSLLIWVVGPLIAIADIRPLEGPFARFALIILLFVLWAISLLLAQRKARRSNENLVAGLTQAEAKGAAAPGASDEAPQLRERFQEALALLKRSKLGGETGRQHLYQLPWYVIIGPPGAGKTTALVNSELNFPLADQLGRNAIRGVGGTRNCEWWFTDDAVLIDTAGRYTTQDSDAPADASAWAAFLGLLQKTRPRQPINGVLLAISLGDLATMPEAERMAHARAVKARIGEIRDRLGIRVPVYVLFTKADLVAGFVEFFEDLGREDRQQVWGITFPSAEGKEGADVVAAFGAEFDLLVRHLNDRLLARLQQEADAQRRALIFAFPQQFASLKGAAETFLAAIFKPSRLEEAPVLRGVYFTSGTQLGTPFDRLLGAMASTFGIARQAITAFSGTGRSYFLTRLLKDVVFAEAGLVSANRRVERRNAWVRRGVYAVAAVILVALGGAWVNSYVGNQSLIDAVRAAAQRYDQQVKGLKLSSFDPADLRSIVPPLDTLRSMPTGYDDQRKSVPVGMTLGLYQGDKLGFQAVDSYRRALSGMLLPRLVGQLEGDMRANLNRPDYLYEALKVYLMLGSEGPLDPALVKEWMTLDWQRLYPDPSDQAARTGLASHLNALLATPLATVPLDGALVEQVRQILAQLPLAQRAYSLIVHSAAARQLPQWNVLTAGGPQTDRVFVRRSGKPLTEGIPGLYTYNGFHQVFLPQLSSVAGEVAKESWVLGPNHAVKPSPDQVAKLEKDVRNLYLTDYALQWDTVLSDLTIVPFTSLPQTIEVLNILSGPSSPLRSVLTAAAKETTLTAPPPATTAAGAKEAAKDAAGKLVSGNAAASRLAALVGGGAAATERPGQTLDDRYKPLHDLVAGSPSELDRVVTILAQLYEQLTKVTLAPNQGEAMVSSAIASASGPAALLKAEAGRLPAPLRDWMGAILHGNSKVTVGGVRERINTAWKSDVLPFCREALENRFPIDRNATADVTIADFSRLFAPGGMIDTFFQTQLKPFVDTAQRPWRWQQVENVNLGGSASGLQEFQRAAAIRDGLFANGSKVPQVSFQVTPVALDAKATQVLLSIDGQLIVYQHGPTLATRVQWPGPGGQSEARIAFSGADSPTPASLSVTGPWAWFRLLDKGKIARSMLSDRLSVTFDIGQHSAKFELEANSVINPFMLDALERFRCPPSL